MASPFFRKGPDLALERPRKAVLADDHDPVAGPDIIELEDNRRVSDDGCQCGVSPREIALHQGGVVWTVARERLDDVADPIRQLGQDLVRFVSRRRPVHARSAEARTFSSDRSSPHWPGGTGISNLRPLREGWISALERGRFQGHKQ